MNQITLDPTTGFPVANNLCVNRFWIEFLQRHGLNNSYREARGVNANINGVRDDPGALLQTLTFSLYSRRLGR